MARKLKPIHPGEILREEFMQPMGISINHLAREIYVPPGRISEIVNGKRGITADTAYRDPSPHFSQHQPQHGFWPRFEA